MSVAQGTSGLAVAFSARAPVRRSAAPRPALSRQPLARVDWRRASHPHPAPPQVEFPSKPSVSAEAKAFMTRCLAYSQAERWDVLTAAADPYLQLKR